MDGAFIGFRDAAGRSALIDKRRYYRAAMARGAAIVQLPVAAVGAAALAWERLSPEPEALARAFGSAASGMLLVYVPYALVVLAAFAMRAASRTVDMRSAMHLLILGPFTLLRPPVVVAGCLAGLLAAPRQEVAVMEIVILTSMVALEPALGLLHSGTWRTDGG